MNFQEEAPSAPPVSNRTSYPWTHRVQYKSGKVAQAFAQDAKPEQVKAGFSYYDKEAGQNVALSQFRAIVVAPLSGVSGVSKEGDTYFNYWSNLVSDTKTQTIEVFCQGIDRAQMTGIYQEIKPDFPKGVGYTQVLICYVPELKQFVSLNLTVGLQTWLRQAIAAQTGARLRDISLYSLCDLTTKFWGFKFTGNFVKCDKEGNRYNGSGEMYFMPDVTVFEINENKTPAESFKILVDGSAACSAYVNDYQTKFSTWQQPAAFTNQHENHKPVSVGVSDPSFPAIDVTSHDDDLPF